ncbi:disintegrin and metalloproteinase domain-containing protein 10-like [Gigantopelta aegis]|uniref:disintegrin and metalloproteinase domain-containing protein 10-like n=1 Tax=Gigantopelta aegis TaxID=1735272 RepID=UPI001B88C354|nr:disintegrin and metalloproteinase domain-containing protein 10-like [Gigantopelta aegis]
MAKIVIMIINFIMLHSLHRCKLVAITDTNWFSNKKYNNEQQMNKDNLVPSGTYETDIQFQNIITTFNNTSYEKNIKFRAFDSHFNIYLKKQPLFHHKMTITHQVGSNTNVDIPIFYIGFNYDVSLSAVRGRFHSNNFKGRLSWNNITIEIDCPNAKAVDRDINLKYVLSCKINSFKSDDPIVTDDYIFLEQKHRDWDHVKNNTYRPHHRHRRSPKQRRSCGVHLVADHLYFKHVGSLSLGSTVEAMASSLATADAIFRSTDFDGDGFGDNVGFVVENITIYNNPYAPGYKLKETRSLSVDYLRRFAEYDFSNYCLGVAFTYTDFERGIIGLAWAATANRYKKSGGICESAQSVRRSIEQVTSYNSLLISQLNDGKFCSREKAALALTHEFGHSFGAIHDKLGGKGCAPNNEYGNYIMYEYVVSGDKPNNKQFSSCSIEYIHPVIVRKGFCLKTDTGPVCGNAIIEDGEECDCGTSGTCRYIDPCCVPSDVSNSVDIPCTFGHNKTKTCSPKRSDSACCSEDCVPISSSRKQTCKHRSDCTRASYCDGVSSSCPAPVNLPDGKSCNGGRQICVSGKCSKSICEWLKLKDCQCTSKPLYCHVCCKEYNASKDECAPVGGFAGAPKYSVNLRTEKGYGCNANTGFCDDKHVCVMESLDNVLDIVDTFLSSRFQRDIDDWIKNHLFYVFLGIVFIVAIIMVFVIRWKMHHDTHVEALRVGRLTIALEEALGQTGIYFNKLKTFEKKMNCRIRQIMFGIEMDSVDAVVRLSLFFPTASVPLLLETAKCSANEEAAVRILLIRGFPMRGFCVSVVDDPSHCLLQTDPTRTP